jgi:hypothetical protein
VTPTFDILLDPQTTLDGSDPKELALNDSGGRREPRLWPVPPEPAVEASETDEPVLGEALDSGALGRSLLAVENQFEAEELSNRGEEDERELASRQEPSLSPAAEELFTETGLRIAPDERPIAPPPVLPARRPRSRRVSEFLAGVVTALVAVAIYLLVTHPGNFLGHPTPAVATAPGAPSEAPAPSSSVATAPAGEVPAAPAPLANASPGNGATNAPATKAAPAADAEPKEMLPPQQGVGQLLSLEQVRYCVFQGRRLGYLRNQIVSDDSVQRFNTLLADFNSRCKSFRYEGDALQSANRQADARQDRLKADAAGILTSWTGESATVLIDLQARKGAALVQARLKALGYYRGKVDGAWGARSATALSKFRQKTGLGDGALWDLATQSALLGQ